MLRISCCAGSRHPRCGAESGANRFGETGIMPPLKPMPAPCWQTLKPLRRKAIRRNIFWRSRYMARTGHQMPPLPIDNAYNRDRTGPNAPGALLGLANSLTSIQQSAAACDTLSSLNSQFPTPPAGMGPQITGRRDSGRIVIRKAPFSEEKEPKRLLDSGPWAFAPTKPEAPRVTNVFCFFFAKKKRFSLPH